MSEAPSAVIDLDRYPIDDLESPKAQALLAFCRASLEFEAPASYPVSSARPPWRPW